MATKIDKTNHKFAGVKNLSNEYVSLQHLSFSISLRGFDARVNDAVKDFDDKGRNQHHDRDQINVTAEISG